MNQGILGLAMGFAGGFSQSAMQPPTDLTASYFDTGFDITTTIDWIAPAGPTPDTYNFQYNSAGIGFFTLTLSGTAVQEIVFGEYYNVYWGVYISSQKAGYSDSTQAFYDGTTPPGSYP